MGPAASGCRCRTRWRSNQPGLTSAAKSRSMVSCTRCTGIPALHRSAIILLLWFSWPGTDMATRSQHHTRPTTISAATHANIVEKTKKKHTNKKDDLNAIRVTLPTLPEVAMQVRRLVQDPKNTTAQNKKVIN